MALQSQRPEFSYAHSLAYNGPHFKLGSAEPRLIFGRETDPKIIMPITHPEIWSVYMQARANMWVAEEIPCGADGDQFDALDEDTRNALLRSLAYLSTSDATVPAFNALTAMDIVTDCTTRMALMRQMMEEAEHTRAYQYMFEFLHLTESETVALLSLSNTMPSISNKLNWNIQHARKLKEVVMQLQLHEAGAITSKSSYFDMEREAVRNLLKALAAYLVFEYVYFPLNFSLMFAVRTFQSKLLGFEGLYRYIFRDEIIHARYSIILFNAVKKDFPQYIDAELMREIRETFTQAYDLEVAAAADVFRSDSIAAGKYSKAEYLSFAKYLLGMAARSIGEANPYRQDGGIGESPLPWMVPYYSNALVTNIFESKAITYSAVQYAPNESAYTQTAASMIRGVV